MPTDNLITVWATGLAMLIGVELLAAAAVRKWRQRKQHKQRHHQLKGGNLKDRDCAQREVPGCEVM